MHSDVIYVLELSLGVYMLEIGREEGYEFVIL